MTCPQLVTHVDEGPCLEDILPCAERRASLSEPHLGGGRVDGVAQCGAGGSRSGRLAPGLSIAHCAAECEMTRIPLL